MRKKINKSSRVAISAVQDEHPTIRIGAEIDRGQLVPGVPYDVVFQYGLMGFGIAKGNLTLACDKIYCKDEYVGPEPVMGTTIPIQIIYIEEAA